MSTGGLNKSELHSTCRLFIFVMPLYLGWWILFARNMRTFFWIVIRHAFRYRILYFTAKQNRTAL